jgi:hypothetical protein
VLRGGAGASSGVPFQLARAMGSAKDDVIGPFRKRLSAARSATIRNIDDAESQFISLSACVPLRPVGGRGNVGLRSELTFGRASATSIANQGKLAQAPPAAHLCNRRGGLLHRVTQNSRGYLREWK